MATDLLPLARCHVRNRIGFVGPLLAEFGIGWSVGAKVAHTVGLLLRHLLERLGMLLGRRVPEAVIVADQRQCACILNVFLKKRTSFADKLECLERTIRIPKLKKNKKNEIQCARTILSLTKIEKMEK
jgi:hypothetical protein